MIGSSAPTGATAVSKRNVWMEAAGEIVAVKVGTNDNTADILTKTLTGERHRTLAAQLRGRCWIQKLG